MWALLINLYYDQRAPESLSAVNLRGKSGEDEMEVVDEPWPSADCHNLPFYYSGIFDDLLQMQSDQSHDRRFAPGHGSQLFHNDRRLAPPCHGHAQDGIQSSFYSILVVELYLASCEDRQPPSWGSGFPTFPPGIRQRSCTLALLSWAPARLLRCDGCASAVLARNSSLVSEAR